MAAANITGKGPRIYAVQHNVWVAWKGENLSDCDFSRSVSSTENRTTKTGGKEKRLVGFGGFLGAKVPDPDPVNVVLRTDTFVLIVHAAGLKGLLPTNFPADFAGSYDLSAISKSNGVLKGRISYNVLVSAPQLAGRNATSSASQTGIVIPPVLGFQVRN